MASVQVLENFINGEFVSCVSHLDSYNPAIGEVHLKIPDSGKEEVNAAVHAAKNAFKKSVYLSLFTFSSCFMTIGGLRLLPKSAQL